MNFPRSKHFLRARLNDALAVDYADSCPEDLQLLRALGTDDDAWNFCFVDAVSLRDDVKAFMNSLNINSMSSS